MIMIGGFDPALPEEGAVIIAKVLRDAFTELFGLIQNVPPRRPGPQRPAGPQGPEGSMRPQG